MGYRKLYRRSAREADRLLWISLTLAASCAVCAALLSASLWVITLMLVLPIYSLLRRVRKGPPVGKPLLERSEEMLVLRNPSSVPSKTDRIPIGKIHSISYRGEHKFRFFDLVDKEGQLHSIGPFTRMPSTEQITNWFSEALPEVTFQAPPSVQDVHHHASGS